MDLNPLDDYALRSPRLNRAVYLAILVVAFLLRVPHFSPRALVGVDTAIYVYCAEHGYFPHAPYLVHSLIGFLLSPFLRLDWGYSVVSMVSSLISVLFFSWTIERLYCSRVAGWVAGTVLACTPVCLRFAGIQEIYSLQFFMLSWTWYVCSGGKHRLLAGVLFGTTMATHTGTIFAFPTTLWLLWTAVCHRADSVRSEGEGSSGWVSIPTGRCGEYMRSLLFFLAGMSGVGLLAVSWVVYLWSSTPGAPELSYLPVFLRGSAPSLDWGKFSQGGAVLQFFVQLIRTWNDLADPQVIGAGLLGTSLFALFLHPWRITLPWWLLSLPYLLYEMLVTYSLDAGIYCVFIVPSVAASVALCAVVPRGVFRVYARLVLVLVGLFLLSDLLEVGPVGLILVTLMTAFLIGKPHYKTVACAAFLGLGLFFAIAGAEYCQSIVKTRNLMCWYREQGAAMALSRWVRENTPRDTIVCHPQDWLSFPYAAPLYAEREPIFRTADRLALTPWRPLMHDFKALPKVTVEEIDHWLSEERPLVSYDPEPFSGYLTYWGPEFAERYEARPILWLDRNQSGTSELWAGCRPIAALDIGDPDAEKQAHLTLPRPVERGKLQAPLYHPTLYWIARRTDTGIPAWVRDLQAKVPMAHVGAPPGMEDEGISIDKTKPSITFEFPAIPGKTHILRHRLQSGGQIQYIMSCSLKVDGHWVRVGADMEQIYGPPDRQFTDFFFRVPGDFIHQERVTLKLSASHECKEINVYRIDWAVAGEGSSSPLGM